MISVEVAGPAVPSTMNLIPNEIRGMAGWVIERCVIEGAGSGGFVTKDISNLIRVIVNPETNLDLPLSMSTLIRHKVCANIQRWKRPGNCLSHGYCVGPVRYEETRARG